MNREVSGQSSFSVCDDEDMPNFWEVYRALGQCYEAEIARLQAPSQGAPFPENSRFPSKRTRGHPGRTLQGRSNSASR